MVQGNINLIEAAVKHGVKKFVLVTSIGAGAWGRRRAAARARASCTIAKPHRFPALLPAWRALAGLGLRPAAAPRRQRRALCPRLS